jgi:cellulose synthase/poly-beta-1,6-N-acetylglucosamine synthase-like glycosyltransferase
MSMLVSVIIPVFNQRGTLLRAVQSALSQRDVETEVIVVDDGSTDGSVDALKPVLGQIRYARQPNAGVAAARNLGMSWATGEFISFLDADDYWLDGFLARTTGFLHEHPECGAVSTAYYVDDGISKVLAPTVLITAPETFFTGVVSNFFETYARYRHVWTGTVVILREVVEEAGRMRADLAVAEDMEYWLRIGTSTTWGFIIEPLAVYTRTSPGSLTDLSVRGGLLPDIETWQREIVPRLRDDHVAGFTEFRRWMATTGALNFLANGFPAEARAMTRSGFVSAHGLLGLLIRLLRPAPLPVWRLAGWLMTAALAFRAAQRCAARTLEWHSNRRSQRSSAP